jgi:hypothetical protein
VVKELGIRKKRKQKLRSVYSAYADKPTADTSLVEIKLKMKESLKATSSPKVYTL